jgi:hypothetical protein
LTAVDGSLHLYGGAVSVLAPGLHSDRRPSRYRQPPGNGGKRVDDRRPATGLGTFVPPSLAGYETPPRVMTRLRCAFACSFVALSSRLAQTER